MLVLLVQMLFCFTFLTFCSIEVIVATLATNAVGAIEGMRDRYGIPSAYLLNVFCY